MPTPSTRQKKTCCSLKNKVPGGSVLLGHTGPKLSQTQKKPSCWNGMRWFKPIHSTSLRSWRELGLMHLRWCRILRINSVKEASYSSNFLSIDPTFLSSQGLPQIFCFSHSLLHIYLSPLGVANIIAVLFTILAHQPTFPQPRASGLRVGFWYPSHPREISWQLGKGCNPVDVFLEL